MQGLHPPKAYQEELDAVNSFFPGRLVPRYDILEFVQKRKEPAANHRVGSTAATLPRKSDRQKAPAKESSEQPMH